MREKLEEFKIDDTIRSYFKGKKALVCEKNSITKATLVQFLGDLGIITTQIDFTPQNYDEAFSILENKKPEVVIYNMDFCEGNPFKLFEKHEELLTNRLECTFVMLSNSNSISMASCFLDYDIDGYVASPFSTESLQHTILKGVLPKIKATEGRVLLEKGRSAFLENKTQEAIDLLEKSLLKLKEKESAHAYALLGQAYEKMGDKKKASYQYREGLKKSPTNYRCLKNLSNLLMDERHFDEAYKINKIILDHFPFNPNRVPEMIKLSIATKNYGDVLKLCEILRNHGARKEVSEKYVTAGLFVAGKFFIGNEQKEKGIEVLKESVVFSKGDPDLLEQVCLTLASHNNKDLAVKLLEKYSGKKLSRQHFYHIQLQIFYLTKDFAKVLKMYETLKGSRSLGIEDYEMVIRSGVSAQLSPGQMKSIIETATKTFPDQSTSFLSLSKAKN